MGVSGVDAGLIRARRRPPVEVGGELVDYGFVGDVAAVEPRVLTALMDAGYVPVVSPLSAADDGTLLNINANAIASALAVALGAEKLLFIAGAAGILERQDDAGSLRLLHRPRGAAAAGRTPAVWWPGCSPRTSGHRGGAVRGQGGGGCTSAAHEPRRVPIASPKTPSGRSSDRTRTRATPPAIAVSMAQLGEHAGGELARAASRRREAGEVGVGDQRAGVVGALEDAGGAGQEE